ncbi:tetraspanin-like protein 3 [Sarcoptes scabiei]|uniref:Tetraspanin n=1 Tax=Sarcoptes scabiei TaxID=52283 RepID=A0A131ZZW2_SARSC|nr:tetraspanin-like protein 3 [Sarcoptes scabiei]
MAKTCGSGFIKLALIVLNSIYLVLGIGIIYVGSNLVHLDWSNPGAFNLADVNFKAISFIILSIGIVVVLVSGLGFLGSCCDSSAMLNAIENEIENGIKKAINEINSNNRTAEILQKLQERFKCCGWNGPDDYNGSMILSSCCDQYPKQSQMCSKSDVVFKSGCKEKLNLYKYFGSSTGLGIAIILVQLVLILAACCLARDI